MELKTPPNQVNAMSCQKCNQSQLVNFRAAMVPDLIKYVSNAGTKLAVASWAP
jgi:hypothetical protein